MPLQAERAKSKHALIMAGEKLSAHLNVEVSVRHQQAQDALELFRSAPMEVEKVRLLFLPHAFFNY